MFLHTELRGVKLTIATGALRGMIRCAQETNRLRARGLGHRTIRMLGRRRGHAQVTGTASPSKPSDLIRQERIATALRADTSIALLVTENRIHVPTDGTIATTIMTASVKKRMSAGIEPAALLSNLSTEVGMNPVTNIGLLAHDATEAVNTGGGDHALPFRKKSTRMMQVRMQRTHRLSQGASTGAIETSTVIATVIVRGIGTVRGIGATAGTGSTTARKIDPETRTGTGNAPGVTRTTTRIPETT